MRSHNDIVMGARPTGGGAGGQGCVCVPCFECGRDGASRLTRVPVLTGGGQDLVSGVAGTGGATQPGLVTWAAGRRRWPAGVGDGNEMAGGGGGADGWEDDVGRVRPDGTGGPS